MEVLGCRGMKLWPLTGLLPDEICYYPLFEEVARLGVNIVVHMGNFREVVFIMARFGAPWVEEALAVAGKNPNVFADISACQMICKAFPMALSQTISMAKLLHGGVHKVFFGSDFPCFTELYSQKEWVDFIKGLERPVPLQIMGLPEITAHDKELVLGRNAQTALKLV